MKWKLTNRFLMTVMSIIFIVIIVNSIILFAFLLYKTYDTSETNAGETVIHKFENYVSVTNDEINVSEEGLDYLKKQNAWVQFLNTNGDVIKSYQTDELDLKTHYSPIELIQMYKYKEVDYSTTTYIVEVEPYSMLVGVSDSNITRTVLTLDTHYILSVISQYLLFIFIADILIALIAGLLFGSILTKPLYRMIEQIQMLKNKQFQLTGLKRPGIYKNVFKNLQEVSSELSIQEEERNKLEKMRNDWISNVSHDMKTPLASIKGYSELLLDDSVTEEERKNYASVITRQSNYMKDLLDDFTLTTRLRNAEMPLQFMDKKIDIFVKEIVIDVLNDTQFDGYSIQFESDEDVPSLSIDPHLMKRALLNFIVNACIYNNPSTNISVNVQQTTNEVSIRIHDDGNGIRKEDLPNIFDRYYRGTNTSNIQGTGLGMAISRDIILAHNGSVEIDSEENIGTTVTIKLPK